MTDDWYSERRELQASGEPRAQPLTPKPASEPRWSTAAIGDPDRLIDILTPALILVGAAGMSREDRAEWMLAAGAALGHLPEDLLRQGTKAAMRTADHPSKIVPAIIAATAEDLKWRQENRRHIADSNLPRLAAPEQTPAKLTAEEVAELYAIAAGVNDHGLRMTLRLAADRIATENGITPPQQDSPQ